jgi:phosphate-selective porin
VTTDGADTVTVNEAEPGGTFLIFNDIVPDNLLNLRFGVMSNEFFYLSAPRQTTTTDYLAPVSPDLVGLEVNGVHPAGVRYAAGYGNDEVEVGTVDNNLRGYYGWATYTLQGQTLGVRYNSAKAGTVGAEETHTQVDGNVDLHYGPANLVLGYFTQNKVGGVSGAKQNNLLAELIYVAGPKVLVTGRYETQGTETSAGSVAGTDKQTVLNVSYYMLPNMKLMAEYSKLKGDEALDRGLDTDNDPSTIEPSTIDQDIIKIAFQVGF